MNCICYTTTIYLPWYVRVLRAVTKVRNGLLLQLLRPCLLAFLFLQDRNVLENHVFTTKLLVISYFAIALFSLFSCPYLCTSISLTHRATKRCIDNVVHT